MQSNRKYEMQEAILWNLRCLRSGFGKQVQTARATEPSGCIGTASRDAIKRQYLSAEHNRAMPGNVSQGSIYKTYGGFGTQWDSMRATSARPQMGSGPRCPKESATRRTPGPGNYRAEMSIGTQHNARRATSARPTFGDETRSGRDRRFMTEELEKTAATDRRTPGPHEYETQVHLGHQPLSTKRRSATVRIGTARRFGAGPDGGVGLIYNASPSALGSQVYSRKKTLPSFGFGTSTRDGARNVYLSKEHGKVLYGLATPGPMTSPTTSAFHLQRNSQKATQPSFGFGSARRLPKYGTDTPSAATYCA